MGNLINPALKQVEAFENVAACAAAYQVGRTEAGAATNLFSAVTPETKEKLKELVRTGIKTKSWWFMVLSSFISYLFQKSWLYHYPWWNFCRIHGQPKFVLHDGIAAGLFNAKYNGAGSQFGAWDKWLTNTQELVNLLLGKMKEKRTMRAVHPACENLLARANWTLGLGMKSLVMVGIYKMHQNMNQPAQEQLQRICGVFLACLVKFQEQVPSSYFEQIQEELMSTFLATPS